MSKIVNLAACILSKFQMRLSFGFLWIRFVYLTSGLRLGDQVREDMGVFLSHSLSLALLTMTRTDGAASVLEHDQW